MAVSRQRVYGTTVHGGLRHIATGMIDGTFAKKKGEWDTNTRCGQYVAAAVEEGEDLVVTCLLCLGRRQHTGSILRGEPGILRGAPGATGIRGMTADVIFYDEAQDVITNPCAEIELPTAFAADTPSTPPPPSDEGRPASRRSR
jgi:hypothetical protein